MFDERITVTSYAGYRYEELPRAFFVGDVKIKIVEVLDTWLEEGLNNRTRRRFFKVRGDDGFIHEIYLDEKRTEWYRRVR